MKNYKELFEQIKKFKEEQEKQKQRGLNNYNMFTTISKAHYENNHSKMIASFLDPFGEYIQFHKNAKENFINGLMNLIKIFELDSNLITDINNYLNEKDKN